MLTFDEYRRYDATGLAEAITTGELKSGEVLYTAIKAIERLNPDLNAVVATMFEQARDEHGAGERSGAPLWGVPYLVKDLNMFVAGFPATNGSYALRHATPVDDGELTRRLRSAGLLIVGKTNTPEFGLNIDTASELHGQTLNPLDPSLSPGGSSGGSASAVAAGMVPAAHATDSGGSIRIPASNCGLFGMKPSRAVIPLGNDAAEGLGGLSTGHAITHSVRDSQLLHRLTSGSLTGDSYMTPRGSQIGSPLRVAVWAEGFDSEFIDPQCQQAARNAGELCEQLGMHVEERRPPVNGTALRSAFDVLFTANIAATLSAIGSNPTVEPITAACAAAASRFSAADYVGAIALTHQMARSMGEFFEDYDVLLTPTLARPPRPIGELSMQDIDWSAYLQRMLDDIPFTPLFNMTGGPAMSVPLGQATDGMPIGVQFGASIGSDQRLFDLARSLEEAAPWHDRI